MKTKEYVIIFQMGYAQHDQKGLGLHLRLYSRAFIIQTDESDASKPIVFVNLDAGMPSQILKTQVCTKSWSSSQL